MFLIIKKTFTGLLTGIVSVNNHANCVSLNEQKCTTQPSIINLHPNEYTQGFLYYQFVVNLYKCVGSCNSLNDLSNKVFVPNKTEDLNLSVFYIVTKINESKSLTKHI